MASAYRICRPPSLLCRWSNGVLCRWSNGGMAFLQTPTPARPACRSPPDIPEIVIPKATIHNCASELRVEVNRGFAVLQEVATAKDLKKYLLVVAGLWFLSVIGSWCEFLTLASCLHCACCRTYYPGSVREISSSSGLLCAQSNCESQGVVQSYQCENFKEDPKGSGQR